MKLLIWSVLVFGIFSYLYLKDRRARQKEENKQFYNDRDNLSDSEWAEKYSPNGTAIVWLLVIMIITIIVVVI
jgi:hypothetical protein